MKGGQEIGRTNLSGRSKGAHAHFTLREGTPENPATPATKFSDPWLLFKDLDRKRK